jgi:hypothetical protein
VSQVTGQYYGQYQQQPGEPRYPAVSLGNWIFTLILTAIPLVGFILLLVWAFDGSTNPSKKNYARAVLILALIGVILWVVFGVILGWASALFSNPWYY